MPSLTLRYDYCAQRRPYYLSKPEIEAVAREARRQLLPPGTDRFTLEHLAAVSELNVNDLPYQLWVSMAIIFDPLLANKIDPPVVY